MKWLKRLEEILWAVLLWLVVASVLLSVVGLLATDARAEPTAVYLDQNGSTYKVVAQVPLGPMHAMLDSGATISVIPPEAAAMLVAAGVAEPHGELTASMANGSIIRAQTIMVSQIEVGGCVLNNVEFAVVNRSGPILGLNVIRRLMPFTFGVEGVEFQCRVP